MLRESHPLLSYTLFWLDRSVSLSHTRAGLQRKIPSPSLFLPPSLSTAATAAYFQLQLPTHSFSNTLTPTTTIALSTSRFPAGLANLLEIGALTPEIDVQWGICPCTLSRHSTRPSPSLSASYLISKALNQKCMCRLAKIQLAAAVRP
jgi:hypothetical protein